VLDAGLPAPARGAFTTRYDGFSSPPYDELNLALHVGDSGERVARNRARLAAELGVRALAFCQQVHGSRVHVVDSAVDAVDADDAVEITTGIPPTGVEGTDALVSAVPGVGLVVMGADCLPVLLAAPGARVVGAAHVGRGGLVGGVLGEAVAAMRAMGAEDVVAVVGPGICGRCYEVPAALADDVEAAAPGTRCTTRVGTAGVDLLAGARGQLERLGVPVTSVGGCTLEQPERFYSYRRDGVTGRHAGVVWLEAP
jgi:YfiH family protein